MNKMENVKKDQKQPKVWLLYVRYGICFVVGVLSCLIKDIEIKIGNNLTLLWTIFSIFFAIISFLYLQSIKTIKEAQSLKDKNGVLYSIIKDYKKTIKIDLILIVTNMCLAFFGISIFTFLYMINEHIVIIDKVHIAIILGSFYSSINIVLELLSTMTIIHNFMIEDD